MTDLWYGQLRGALPPTLIEASCSAGKKALTRAP